MRRWQISRYTLSQILNALDRSESSPDPHAGNIPITSLDDIEALFG